MTPDLQKALDEITAALAPLPEGYYIEADEPNGAILVCSKNPEPEGLGFAVSAMTIAEDRHVEHALGSFPELVKQVEMGVIQ